MMRAALYGRFSSDLQNPGSIADQARVCRAHAARIGASVVAEYSDAAISGAAAVNRPGLQQLLADAAAGGFDVVIAEALDRLSRSLADMAAIHDDLVAAGVAISTVAEADVGLLHIGLKGTMNALFLEELGRKTRRGIEGALMAGRLPGQPPYGYAADPGVVDGAVVKGRWRTVPAEAAIVRRIFADYLAGASPGQIAAALNAQGVPSPRGTLWAAQTIRGCPARATGILNTAAYNGEIVWGRTVGAKDRRSGTVRSRIADPARMRRVPREDLRLVDAATWAAVKARQDVLAHGRPEAARTPRHLLQGLLRCAGCGRPMRATGLRQDHGKRARRFVCATKWSRGEAACPNRRTALAIGVETRVLAAVAGELTHPAAVEAFVREFHAAAAERARGGGRERAEAAKELAEVERRAGRLVDQVAEGAIAGRAVAERLAGLEARRAALEARLDALAAPAPITLHPDAPRRFAQAVAALQTTLARGDTREDIAARALLREVVRTVWFHPGEAKGEYHLVVESDLAPLLDERPTPTAKASSGLIRSHRPEILVRLAG
ncbi:MAG TPA: recombinase family protein [Caulobacteraceae bacterium]|jgi:DNA invertase Pin-like site-specific DNA recombinase